MARPLLAVAHRAGNGAAALRAALDAGVDLVEADVHRYRGATEVRHWKALGPRLLWERWALARRRDVAVPGLAEVLAALGGDPRIMLDLKGVHPRLAPAVAAQLRVHAPGAPVTVCTQHWWMLDAFAGDPHVRLVLSAGSRAGLWRLRRRLRAGRLRAGRSGAGRGAGSVYGVAVHLRLLTPAVVAELHEAVPTVLTWPVDGPAALADARRLGVGGVISKDLGLLRALVADR